MRQRTPFFVLLALPALLLVPSSSLEVDVKVTVTKSDPLVDTVTTWKTFSAVSAEEGSSVDVACKLWSEHIQSCAVRTPSGKWVTVVGDAVYAGAELRNAVPWRKAEERQCGVTLRALSAAEAGAWACAFDVRETNGDRVGNYVREVREINITMTPKTPPPYEEMEEYKVEALYEKTGEEEEEEKRPYWAPDHIVREDEDGNAELVCVSPAGWVSCVFDGPKGDYTVLEDLEYLDSYEGYGKDVRPVVDRAAGKCGVKVDHYYDGDDYQKWECKIQAEVNGRFVTASNHFNVAKKQEEE